MSKYTEDAKRLLAEVGGKENIKAVTHCATRMRFVLNDPSKANIKAIEALPSVKGSFTQAGQFQVIVGNDVSTFFNEFQKETGGEVQSVSKDEVKSAGKSNMTGLQRAMANLAEIFAPLIPALVTGGLLLGFRNLLGLSINEAPPLAESSVFWGGVNNFLWLICEAIFHFLPVGIVWSVTRKMGTTPILGIILGITLVSPQLTNAYGYAEAIAKGAIKYWDFGFAKIPMIGYQAQVIPALLAGFVLVYLERFWRKVVPEFLSMIFVPLLALVPAVLLAHTILGPIGWTLGTWVSNIVLAGITGPLKVLFGAIFGFFYAPLVITGLHHMTNAIDLQLVNSTGGTQLWPMIALSNIAQGSAVLGIIWLHRKNKEEQQISLPSMISCYLGVTEPAMFGINLKYMFPFLGAMIGSGLASMVALATGVTALSIGVGGLPGILSIQPQFYIPFIICMVIAIVVPILATIALSKLNRFKNREATGFNLSFK